MKSGTHRMVVIALIGATGSGKTTLLDKLSPQLRTLAHNEWKPFVSGEPDIHKEGYMGSNAVNIAGKSLPEIPNDLVISKLNYLASWLNSMRYKFIIGKGLVISDRCPYDVASYVERPEVLLALASSIRDELKAMGILLRTIWVTADSEERRRRVAERLTWHPERLDYREEDINFQEKTAQFFATNKDIWDETVKSTGVIGEDLKELRNAIGRILKRNSL